MGIQLVEGVMSIGRITVDFDVKCWNTALALTALRTFRFALDALV
jgi:hypothetical protein